MILLASKSPRRKELMSKDITPFFTVEVSHIDESLSYALKAKEAVLDIARRKAEDVAGKHPGDFIIAADTIVVLNGEIIGKPEDEEDAVRILHLLSGKKHTVYTAYCFIWQGKEFRNVAESSVFFRELSNFLIEEYVASGSPMDKAGAYGVQDNGRYPLIDHVEGSVKNVIGFPTEQILEDLKKLGISLSDYQ